MNEKKKVSDGKHKQYKPENCSSDDHKQLSEKTEDLEDVSDHSVNVENTKEKKKKSFLDQMSEVCNKWPIHYVAIAIIIVTVARVCWSSSQKSKNDDDGTNQLDEMFSSWRNKFPNQEIKTWNTIEAQVENFIQDSHISPLVIVFVHNNALHTAELLAWEVSSKTVKLKHNGDKCGDTSIYTLSGNDSFIKKNYILENQLTEIGLCKKLVVQNFEKLSPEAVPDLVSLLDRDYPNVPDAVYIFLLDVPQNFGHRLSSSAQSFLKKLWEEELDEDRIYPVFSRLDSYVKIVPEANYGD